MADGQEYSEKEEKGRVATMPDQEQVPASLLERGVHSKQKLAKLIKWQHRLGGGILGTEALRQLVQKHHLVDPAPQKIDANSIDLHLGNRFAKYKPDATLRYTETVQEDRLERFEIADEGTLTLKPQEAVLAVTKETIAIPKGFFGFIQTKGRLSRGLVTAALDMQFYEGFHGKGGLQLINHHPPESGINIEIPIGSPVAALHILPVRGNSIPYNGRYQGQNSPTF